jgi:hypothetical protein
MTISWREPNPSRNDVGAPYLLRRGGACPAGFVSGADVAGAGVCRVLPLQFEIRNERRHVDQVHWAVAQDLVRDVHSVRLRVTHTGNPESAHSFPAYGCSTTQRDEEHIMPDPELEHGRVLAPELRIVELSGRRQRQMWPRCRWRDGREIGVLGRSASWCEDRRSVRVPGRRRSVRLGAGKSHCGVDERCDGFWLVPLRPMRRALNKEHG